MFKRTKESLAVKGKLYKTGAVVVMAVLLAALAAGLAFAEEESSTQNQSSQTQTQDSSSSSSSSSNSSSSEDGSEESTSKVEPSSEVVTSYYHDTWNEVKEGELNEESVESGETTSETETESTEEDSEEESAEEELDPALNNLGEDNFINLQQTPEGSTLVDIDIVELVSASTTLQKTPVQVRGEVVGDAIKANRQGTKYWLTLNSLEDEEEGSISVLVDNSVIGLIDTYGGYNTTGTILRVKGTFYVACPTHEGIMDIHADSVTVVQHGEITHDTFDFYQFIPGIVLIAIGGLLAFLYRFLAERQR